MDGRGRRPGRPHRDVVADLGVGEEARALQNSKPSPWRARSTTPSRRRHSANAVDDGAGLRPGAGRPPRRGSAGRQCSPSLVEDGHHARAVVDAGCRRGRRHDDPAARCSRTCRITFWRSAHHLVAGGAVEERRGNRGRRETETAGGPNSVLKCLWRATLRPRRPLLAPARGPCRMTRSVDVAIYPTHPWPLRRRRSLPFEVDKAEAVKEAPDRPWPPVEDVHAITRGNGVGSGDYPPGGSGLRGIPARQAPGAMARARASRTCPAAQSAEGDRLGEGTAIEFAGSKVTVTIPAETPRSARFEL